MDALRLMREQILRNAAGGAGRSHRSPLITEAHGASIGADAALFALPLDFTDLDTIEDASGVISLTLDLDALDSAPLG